MSNAVFWEDVVDLESESIGEFQGPASVAGRPVNIGQCIFKIALNLMSNAVFWEDVVDLESESIGEFQGPVWGLIKAAKKPNVADYFSMLRLVDPQGLKRREDDEIVNLWNLLTCRKLQSLLCQMLLAMKLFQL
ncbi:hypothetical protein EJ110_NYTH22465 [Nymphaea thermarum]|nr:hypothetical protein EJ110_NYTH22465 [Nymphaea thermarum]